MKLLFGPKGTAALAVTCLAIWLGWAFVDVYFGTSRFMITWAMKHHWAEPTGSAQDWLEGEILSRAFEFHKYGWRAILHGVLLAIYTYCTLRSLFAVFGEECTRQQLRWILLCAALGVNLFMLPTTFEIVEWQGVKFTVHPYLPQYEETARQLQNDWPTNSIVEHAKLGKLITSSSGHVTIVQWMKLGHPLRDPRSSGVYREKDGMLSFELACPYMELQYKPELVVSAEKPARHVVRYHSYDEHWQLVQFAN